MLIRTISSYRTVVLICASLLCFGGALQAHAAGPMDQGWGWSASYFQVIGDDFSCAPDEIRYDVDYVDGQTDQPANTGALLALFDKGTGSVVDFRYSTNGSVGSVCFNPDEHEISVSVDESASYNAYWSMYREDNPEDIPREKHIKGKVWLTNKSVTQPDIEHEFPTVADNEFLTSSPNFLARVNQLPSLLGASDLSEATIFVYNLQTLTVVDTYTVNVSGGTGVKNLGTVALSDGRYSWGFYMSMDATHDAGQLLNVNGQPNSSFSGLTANFSVDTTDPNLSSFNHLPTNPQEGQDIQLQITAQDPTSSGFYSGIRQVRVYNDGSLVRTCDRASSGEQIVACDVTISDPGIGTYAYYVEVEDWAGNTYQSGSNNYTVSEFFDSQGTISGTSCTIATGNSTCVVNLTWSTSEFIGTPNLINQDSGVLISTDVSGTLGVSVGPADDVFRLIDTGAGTLFTGDTYNANVGCADSNAYWNGTQCVLSPTGSISGTTCNIATGNSTCDITLTWSASNFNGTPSVFRTSSGSIVGTTLTGSEVVSVTPNDDVFQLVDTGAGTTFSGASYNANVGCAAADAVWNGSSCAPLPTGSISGTSCVVQIDDSTCSITLDWSSSNFFGTPEVTRGATVISSSPSASSFVVSAGPASDIFTLNDTGAGSPFTGSSFNATVTCASGSLWDGSICSEGAYQTLLLEQLRQSCAANEFFDEVSQQCLPIPTASISGTSCQIAPGDSTCDVLLNWTLNDPVGDPLVWRGASVLVTGVSGASDYVVTVGPDSDMFSIADSGFASGDPLALYDANVGCASGYFWDGGLCRAIPTGSISGTSCGIATGDSSCEVLLSWTTSDFFGTVNVIESSTPSTPISTALSGVDVAVSAGPSSDVFQLIDTGVGTIFLGDSYNANVTCADADSAWDGFMCVPKPEGTITGTTCSIATGDGSCQITLTWTTSNFAGTPAVTRSSNGQLIGSAVSGSLPVTVNPDSDVFTLTDTGANTLFTGTFYNANVSCADAGSVWNGSQCIPEPSGALSFSSSCQIGTGDSTCQAAISWNTVNFVGTPSVRQGGNLLSNNSSAFGFPVTVTHGNNQVRLQDTGSGTTLNDIVRNLIVTCASADDTWNGTVCAPDIQSGFAVTGQGVTMSCAVDQFLSIQTGICETFPIISPDANEVWTRYNQTANISFSVEAPYEVGCSVKDGDGTDDTVVHNAGAGTDPDPTSFTSTTRRLTSTQIATLSCTAAGMVDPVVVEMRINVIPLTQEI